MGNCKISKPCDGKTEETNIFNLSDEFDVEKIEQLGIDGISLEGIYIYIYMIQLIFKL